jgi:hypothetical protein
MLPQGTSPLRWAFLFLDKYSITGLKTMSTFANVYVGAAANDGTGDPLRNAFQKINTNFSNISAGVAGSGVTSVAGRSGNVVLYVNDVYGAASVAYVNSVVGSPNSISNGLTTVAIPSTDSDINLTVNNTLTWAFDTTGNLTLPEAGTINYASGTSALIDLSQPVNITNTTTTNAVLTGALKVAGGTSVGQNLYVNNVLHIGDQAFNTGLSNPTLVATGGGAQFAQMAMKNVVNTGSADIMAYGDNGSDPGGWIDMGICGTSFYDPGYDITKSNDGYLFVQASNNAFGGNMVLATGEKGLYNDIIIACGGFHDRDEVARFHGNTNTGNATFTVKSQIVANVITANTVTTAGNVTAANISLTGNTGFPTNTSTIRGWARINVGGAAFWTPLYQ